MSVLATDTSPAPSGGFTTNEALALSPGTLYSMLGGERRLLFTIAGCPPVQWSLEWTQAPLCALAWLRV